MYYIARMFKYNHKSSQMNRSNFWNLLFLCIALRSKNFIMIWKKKIAITYTFVILHLDSMCFQRIYIYIFIEAIIICGLLLIKYTLNFHVYFFVMNICYELFDISNLVTLKLVSNK